MGQDKKGALAIVLHTHMPYVEGFGTWPFGEEWLWEAIATSYLPLLNVLDAHPGKLTLSLTPVLCDQLEAPGIDERYLQYLREIRAQLHRWDIDNFQAADEPELVQSLRHSQAQYELAAEEYLKRVANGKTLLDSFAPHVSWTSSATHSVLPLLATDQGVRLQLGVGVESHRKRFGRRWGGGFWLPECAHSPSLDHLLSEVGIRATCVDLTVPFGRGGEQHLQRYKSVGGVELIPVDRAIVELAWSSQGYPSRGAYRESHRFTPHNLRPWAITGGAYDPAQAIAQAREDADDFILKVSNRIAGGGVCVAAFDTELFGHWWHEGVVWLEAVVEAAERHGVPLFPVDELLAQQEWVCTDAPELPTTTWGTPPGLATWSAPSAGGLAWRQRQAELSLFSGGGAEALSNPRVLRELLALQSSDWAFMISGSTAGAYPAERFEGHVQNFERAIAGEPLGPALRSLTPYL